MIPLLPTLAPNDYLPFTLDVSSFLEPNDTILTATASVTPNDLVCTPPIIAGMQCTTFLAGHTATSSGPYTLTFVVTTALGWELQRSGSLLVHDR